jgi:hypothetical protein
MHGDTTWLGEVEITFSSSDVIFTETIHTTQPKLFSNIQTPVTVKLTRISAILRSVAL